MKLTGYQLREALRKWTRKLELAKSQFSENVWEFEGEVKDLCGASSAWLVAAHNVATVQRIQQQYNITVYVDVQGQRMRLADAVKLVGMCGQLDAAWRKAVLDTGKERWDRSGNTRSRDSEYAKKSLPEATLVAKAEEMNVFTSALRAAIALGNTESVDFGDIPEGLI